MTRFCVTVDIEEDLPGLVPDGFFGVDRGLPRLLELLNELDITADFFFLSSVARARPYLVREIAQTGHGIGNHGLDHEFLCAKPLARQESDIVESTRVLESIVGDRPLMFRAPGFSASSTTLGILNRLGYLIDSSVLPGRIVRRLRVFKVYDHRGSPQRPHWAVMRVGIDCSTNLFEIPVTPNPVRPGAPLGLGAVNTYGAPRLLTALLQSDLNPIVFLLHPWELVDLGELYPQIPNGYASACSSDLSALRAFLEGAAEIGTFSTLGAVRESCTGG